MLAVVEGKLTEEDGDRTVRCHAQDMICSRHSERVSSDQQSAHLSLQTHSTRNLLAWQLVQSAVRRRRHRQRRPRA
jgi:hypothetical protein